MMESEFLWFLIIFFFMEILWFNKMKEKLLNYIKKFIISNLIFVICLRLEILMILKCLCFLFGMNDVLK